MPKVPGKFVAKKKDLKPIRIYLAPEERDSPSTQFNFHHRRPRCQEGKTSVENLSRVDIVSHERYNMLVGLTANVFGIPIEEVRTADLAKVFNAVYLIASRLMVDPATKKLKALPEVADQFNRIWLPPDDPFVLTVSAKPSLLGQRVVEAK